MFTDNRAPHNLMSTISKRKDPPTWKKKKQWNVNTGAQLPPLSPTLNSICSQTEAELVKFSRP